MTSYLKAGVAVLFEYDTPKIVHIKSKKVGIINRLIQLAILGYIIGYVIVYQKGYQSTDTVESGVTAKVKGVVFTNRTDLPGVGERIWDVADYVIPSHETNAFFVMTNMVITPNQTLGKCPEDPSMIDVSCDTDKDCPVGEPVVNGNGVRTGKCVPSDRDNGTVCQIHAWCPVEHDYTQPEALLRGSANFTVLIKNSIGFKKFNVKRRNILPDITNKTYLSACRWNEHRDPYCPVFRLGDIVAKAGESYDEIATRGGVMAIEITWDCNLDLNEDKCRPKYSFRRLDNRDSSIAPGWNFRTANVYMENGVETRTLIKAYGILFNIFVRGKAGKFDFIPLILSLGSGLALLGLATVFCDIIVLYVLKQRHLFKNKKYLNVKGSDAYETSELQSSASFKSSKTGSLYQSLED